MHILITGNMGYIGPTLVKHLRQTYPWIKITGFDTGYFGHCLSGVDKLPETMVNTQIYGDIRDFPGIALETVDAIIHLAAISNDPMGDKFESVTHDINYAASIDLARIAKAKGINRFIFASSCSIYGFAEGGPRSEQNELNPLTAYARSKVAMEKSLQELANENFVVTCLRFATACGMSDRVRLDLVLNDFVASAISTNTIEVLSDGTPWRPLITVNDMSRAVDWALNRDRDTGGDFLAINTGASEWNYQVKDLALAVSKAIPNTAISINESAAADHRSYRVNFSLFEKLAPLHQPQDTLSQAVTGLYDGLSGMDFKDSQFRQSDFVRLNMLTKLQRNDSIDDKLMWVRKEQI